MERILDLGCGAGDSWRGLRVPVDHWQVIGIDIQQDRVQIARHKYNARGGHLRARGESIPLANASVNGVFCEVAFPYMHIPRVLAELHRVLAPGGWLRATLHPPSFTWGELKMCFPNPKQTLFRFIVLLNGMVLHCCGGVISVGKMAESCQTDTGIGTALRRAGFMAVSLRHEGSKSYTEARREEVRHGEAAVASCAAKGCSKAGDVRVQRGWASGFGAAALASGFHGLALAGALEFTPKSQT